MAIRDEFYLFTMPGDMCPVWCEMFTSDEGRITGHVVAPTPYSEVPSALAALQAANPGATVDELCYDSDIVQCRGWAQACPLEQIPA